MKRLLFIFPLLMFAQFIQAQVILEKGTKFQEFGGQLRIGMNEGAGTTIGIDLKRGYFLSSKFAVGPELNLYYTHADEDGSLSTYAGGFARAYLNKPTSNSLFFTETGLNFGTIPDPFYYAENSFAVSFHAGMGLGARIGQNAVFEFSLPYRFIRDTENKETTHLIDGKIGITLLLPAKKR